VFPLQLHKPVIAAVEGPCYGLGFELALSCDLRIVGQGARFGFPDQNLYVSYNVASVLLPRMTNAGLGLELLTTGRVMEPERLRKLRLVNKVTASGAALANAQEAAASMARRLTSARDFQKRQVWQLSGVPVVTALAMVRGSTI
jgi:enoyl-CoA hydratase/carnithine racemase